ncbi:hypothetical protein ACT6QE_10695, partial [Staphylococcus aureus]
IFFALLRWVVGKRYLTEFLCPSYQGFRIYRETLSRFSCAASSIIFNFFTLKIIQRFLLFVLQ